MTTERIPNIRIRGLATAVPSTVRHNADIGTTADQDYVSKLSSMLGVVERRIVAENQYGSDLAEVAITQLLESLGWESTQIDILIVATQTPDRLFPGISFTLHRRLNLRKNAIVFDLNLGCSAFTHGLWTVAKLMGDSLQKAVLINVDTMSRTLAAEDYGNQVLFGDGAAATALEFDSTARETLHFAFFSDGKGTESVCLPHSAMQWKISSPPVFELNGPAVMGLALRKVPALVDEVLVSAGLTTQTIDLFVPHQANGFILDKLQERVKVADTKVVNSMKRFGNTSSCSIPLAICDDLPERHEYSREKVLLAGFGTGFSISTAVVDLAGAVISKPIDV